MKRLFLFLILITGGSFAFAQDVCISDTDMTGLDPNNFIPENNSSGLIVVMDATLPDGTLDSLGILMHEWQFSTPVIRMALHNSSGVVIDEVTEIELSNSSQLDTVWFSVVNNVLITSGDYKISFWTQGSWITYVNPTGLSNYEIWGLGYGTGTGPYADLSTLNPLNMIESGTSDIGLFAAVSCFPDTGIEIEGCTYDFACNYNPLATIDDGSCQKAGCMDTNALNFEQDASCDDGSCLYLNFCDGDSNGDGAVNVLDFVAVSSNFGSACP